MFNAFIVEDEPLMRDYLVSQLTQIHPHWQAVASAKDGIEATEWLAAHHCDLIISDIRMPGMDGLTLAQHVKKNYPATHMLILSGFDEFSYAQTALRLQICDYLLKPLNDQELRAALDKIAQLLRDRPTRETPSPAHPLIAEIAAYLLEHFHESLSLSLLAERFNVTPTYLSALFHKEAGESYTQFLLRLRMEKAAVFLRKNPTAKVYDIAQQVGFISSKHFISAFKKYYGTTPKEYQERGEVKHPL